MRATIVSECIMVLTSKVEAAQCLQRQSDVTDVWIW